MIPKPPKRKSKKIEFPDPDFHQQKKDFNKQIREVILGFYKILPRSKNRDSLLKFLDCVLPGKVLDVTRLPYVAVGATSKKETKIACVFALISWTIQEYWDYYRLNDLVKLDSVQKYLEQLQQILSDGLNQYQIRGDFANGFYLARSS